MDSFENPIVYLENKTERKYFEKRIRLSQIIKHFTVKRKDLSVNDVFLFINEVVDMGYPREDITHLYQHPAYTYRIYENFQDVLERYRAANREFFMSLTINDLNLIYQLERGKYNLFTRFILKDKNITSKFEKKLNLTVTGKSRKMMKNFSFGD